MKRSIILGAALAAVVLAGCSKKSGSGAETAASSWKPEKDVTVIVAYKAGSTHL